MGVNLDQFHPNGKPNLNDLIGINLIRLPFIWQQYHGRRESFEQAVALQKPYIDYLVNAGKIVILVLTHQIGLEGKYAPWEQLSQDDWLNIISDYDDIVQRIISVFGNSVIYQIWNECDGLPTGSSVLLTPYIYGEMYRLIYGTAKAFIGQNARCLTAGLKSGPTAAIRYCQEAGLNSFNTWGFAIHEYGRGVLSISKYRQWGLLEDSFLKWRDYTPLNKVWLTEWGTLDAPTDPLSDIAKYAKACANVIKLYRLAGHCWYGVGEGMHNGRGFLNNGVVRLDLQQALWDNVIIEEDSEPEPHPELDEKWVKNKVVGTLVRVRNNPSTYAAPLTTLEKNDILYIHRKEKTDADGYVWRKIYLPRIQQFGYVAASYKGFRLEYQLEQD